MAVPPTNFVPPVIGSLIAWQVYRRIRRHIGRQPLRPRRMIARIILFVLPSLLIAVISAFRPSLLIGFGGGLLLGVPLALFGLRLTRFENTPEGQFYTPNTYIGVALSLLLVARLAYRISLFYAATHALETMQPAFMQSSLTLLLFGILAGYNITYCSGVYLRSREPQLVPNQ